MSALGRVVAERIAYWSAKRLKWFGATSEGRRVVSPTGDTVWVSRARVSLSSEWGPCYPLSAFDASRVVVSTCVH